MIPALYSAYWGKSRTFFLKKNSLFFRNSFIVCDLVNILRFGMYFAIIIYAFIYIKSKIRRN
jgi:hypothetical protein